MQDFTFDESEMENGFVLTMSDGERFLLLRNKDGSAVLYAGLVHFDVNIADKLAAARATASEYTRTVPKQA